MAIYIAVSPLQWRWSVSIDGAIKKSLSTYNASKFNKIKLPINLYLLNKKVSEMYKRDWVMGKDTDYLGIYRAVSKNMGWIWYRVTPHYKEDNE